MRHFPNFNVDHERIHVYNNYVTLRYEHYKLDFFTITIYIYNSTIVLYNHAYVRIFTKIPLFSCVKHDMPIFFLSFSPNYTFRYANLALEGCHTLTVGRSLLQINDDGLMDAMHHNIKDSL